MDGNRVLLVDTMIANLLVDGSCTITVVKDEEDSLAAAVVVVLQTPSADNGEDASHTIWEDDMMLMVIRSSIFHSSCVKISIIFR